MIIEEGEYLAHYGVLRKSGRYPWGSGSTQAARNRSFLDHVEGLRKEGVSDTDIAKGFGLTTTQLRAANSIAKNEQKQADISRAQRLKDKGMSNVAIGSAMGINESSVRALLAPGAKDKADSLTTMSNMLKSEVEAKRFIDIGAGVENQLGISQTKLSTAVAMLKEEGYEVHNVLVDQLGTKNKTKIKVLAPPGTTYKDIVTNKDQIQQIQAYSTDRGRTAFGIQPPINVDPARVEVNYSKKNEKGDEVGGGLADGVIYVRPNVPDLSLGSNRYAQVRIAVGGTHYLKGMAIYKDDLPPGVDLVFNTNKGPTGNKLDAMKPLKRTKDGDVDEDNPFGAIVGQIPKKDANGQDIPNTVSSAMNLVNKEGDWDKWNRTLSTQLLSKQSPVLAKTQLDMVYERKTKELEEILSLTNPGVRKTLLDSYAGDADSSAVHLRAAALPRQATQVILPINSLKETEVYAPNFKNGERVALVRYPHGGVFEIPELTVNNSHAPARKIMGDARDAIGINSKVAERLSGADFDGDTVLVIPNNAGSIRTAPALEGLKNFDPQTTYKAYEGMKPMSARTKGIEMGRVSNLITDMTIKKASNEELARAVRHSMVVIDAEKHNLNYRQSAKDNGISQLMVKYQNSNQGGSSTLISRAKSEIKVEKRKTRSAAKGGAIDKETGERVYESVAKTYINKQGKLVREMQSSTRLAEAKDARELSSGTVIEEVYAGHSNRMKALANRARLEADRTAAVPYSPSAKATYADEVKALNRKLNIALQNKPLERQAQLLANTVVSTKTAAYPEMSASDLKKVKAQALNEARTRMGAKKQQIDLTDREWAAIQAGAISSNKLDQILRNADIDQVKKLATPKTSPVMTPTKQARAEQMLSAGYSYGDIAAALGVSTSTLKSSISGEEG